MSEEKYCELFDEFLESVDGFEPQSIIYFDEDKAKVIDRRLKVLAEIVKIIETAKNFTSEELLFELVMKVKNSEG